MAKPIIDYQLPIEHGMRSNTSRYLRGGGVKELHNMMFNPTEIGVIHNTPGVKQYASGHQCQKKHYESGTWVTNQRGINSIAVIGRIQSDSNDQLCLGWLTRVNANTHTQTFSVTQEPATTATLPPYTYDDGLFPSDPDSAPIATHQLVTGETYVTKFTDFCWSELDWKSGGEPVASDQAQTSTVTISEDTVTSSGGGTWSIDNVGRTLSFTADTAGQSSSCEFVVTADSDGQTSTQAFVWYSFAADHAGILLNRNFHMMVQGRSYPFSSWPAATYSPMEIPLSVTYPTTSSQSDKEVGAIDTATITDSSTTSICNYAVTDSYVNTAGSTVLRAKMYGLPRFSYYFHGTEDGVSMSISDVDGNYDTTITVGQILMPYPGNVAMSNIHTYDMTAQVLGSRYPPYGMWGHATINGYTFFMNGSDNPFALNIDDTTDILTTSTLPLTRADIRQDSGDATVLQVYVGDQGGQSGKGGADYTAGDLIFTGGTPTTSSATGTYSVDAGGAITATALTSSGAGYVTTPVVTGDVGGSGATLTAFMSSYMRATAAVSTSVEDNNVVGFVKYAVSWLDALDAEGPISDFYVGTQANTGSTVSITNIPVGPAGKARLYRTYANREQFFFLEQIEDTADSITASYTDELPDLELGDKIWTHGDAIPDAAFSPVSYYDRLWCLAGTRGSRLYWSDLNEPRSWWHDGNWANIYADDGDQGVALIRAHDGLLIFKQDHLYKFKGRSPQDAILTEVTLAGAGDMSLGAPHIQAIASSVDGVFFFWRGSIYRYFDEKVSVISDSVADRFSDIPKTLWRHIYLGYDPERRLLYASFPPWAIPSSDDTSLILAGATYLYSAESETWLGKMQGHFGPFSNATFHTQATDDADTDALMGKYYRGHLVAGEHNATNYGGSIGALTIGLTNFAAMAPNSVVYFDHLDSLWHGDQAGFNPVADASPLAGSAEYMPDTRFIRYHTARGYPRHRNLLKRFMYVDIPCTAKSDVSHVQLGVRIDGGTEIFLTPTITRAADDDEEVQTLRFSLGYVGRSIGLRTYMATANREDIKFYGPNIGYQLMGRSGTTGWSRTGGLRA